MAKDFDSKVVVVTGASGGIGSTCARMLASRGASVILMELSDCLEQAFAIKKEFQTYCTAIILDVTDDSSVQDAFHKARVWKGRLDCCVNAAGIFIASHPH
jgi:3-oxoacyl-[acyl-carrier protein] reductase